MAEETTQTRSNWPNKNYGTAQTTEEDRSSLSSNDTQQGVKGIEAISSTWSLGWLAFAYVG